jgi:hypothetical protein
LWPREYPSDDVYFKVIRQCFSPQPGFGVATELGKRGTYRDFGGTFYRHLTRGSVSAKQALAMRHYLRPGESRMVEGAQDGRGIKMLAEATGKRE